MDVFFVFPPKQIRTSNEQDSAESWCFTFWLKLTRPFKRIYFLVEWAVMGGVRLHIRNLSQKLCRTVAEFASDLFSWTGLWDVRFVLLNSVIRLMLIIFDRGGLAGCWGSCSRRETSLGRLAISIQILKCCTSRPSRVNTWLNSLNVCKRSKPLPPVFS